MKAIRYDYKQRAYDGRWMELACVKDTENSYQHKTESGSVVTLTPNMWIVTGVYDYLMQIED